MFSKWADGLLATHYGPENQTTPFCIMLVMIQCHTDEGSGLILKIGYIYVGLICMYIYTCHVAMRSQGNVRLYVCIYLIIMILLCQSLKGTRNIM